MFVTFKKYLSSLFCLAFSCLQLFPQKENVLKYVNPFIGTTETKTDALWGSEGGTYPGAVAPSGFVQLTPETRILYQRGYNYNDSSIYWFSCFSHMSGYPEGSSGRTFIIPFDNSLRFQPGKDSRPFSHNDEISEPGYYRIKFRDNGTIVEASASERTGMFRITFPPGTRPAIFIGDEGKAEADKRQIFIGSNFNTIFLFNKDIIEKESVIGGFVLTFAPALNEKNVILIKVGASSVSFESTSANIKAEADTWDFDAFRGQNRQKWVKALSVIEIDDKSKINKTIFYTALYHSFLLPWIISDSQGSYRGADGMIHNTKGNNQYGGFSAWDTFRSLHPLLCLIAPEKQNDIILSMLDQYEQIGRLPRGPMTGNHIIAIIVDSYLKGIRGFDSTLAYKAMKSALSSASRSADMTAYIDLGYVPSSFPESVTRTVEYAYDDWVMAQFAGKVINDQDDYRLFIKRCLNYRNLLDPESLFLLPRNGNSFSCNSGNFGYKEGDKWSYSYFVPQYPTDLINIAGGSDEFSMKLDSAFSRNYIHFDNEPVFHIPYIFNYAGKPAETQKWVRKIIQTHFADAPDGLPGNDDLGSLSSWFVFSAIGLYPCCPGRPIYDIGSPLFEKITLHLPHNKKLIIKSDYNGKDDFYIKSLTFNSSPYEKSWISHSALKDGGEICFRMSSKPGQPFKTSYTGYSFPEIYGNPDFQMLDFSLTKRTVEPNEPYTVRFRLLNKGEFGVKIVRLFVDGEEYAKKNVIAGKDSIVTDSIRFRLYPVGKRRIRIENLEEKEIGVIRPLNISKHNIEVTEIHGCSVFRSGEYSDYFYVVHNTGGYIDSDSVMIFKDDSVYNKDAVILNPGETKKIMHKVLSEKPGVHILRGGSANFIFKTYNINPGSATIQIGGSGAGNKEIINDESGFRNNGIVKRDKISIPPASGYISTGPDIYVEFSNSASLDETGDKITVMAWIYPLKDNHGLAEIISKGDFIDFQTTGDRTLSFFAGGWGRGTCIVPLPANWADNWHHIAGVCTGTSLKVFIDGKETGNLFFENPVSLSSPAKWMLGRNEEFPNDRIFKCFVGSFQVFSESLTLEEIEEEMNKTHPPDI
jgi:putative alpha-1,2-mannosidase